MANRGRGDVDGADVIEHVARRLCGDVNSRLSRNQELRFGTNGSMAVRIAGSKKGTWYCHERKVGGGVLDLIRHMLGLADRGAVEWLQTEFGIKWKLPSKRSRIGSTYAYCDDNGTLLFEVVRFEPKTFRQRRPNGKGGYTWDLKGIATVPYRLPALIAAVNNKRRIYVVEGEKDVETLVALGFAATCNPMGAGKWRGEFMRYFRDADVVIIPDNDEPGREHADQVAANLAPVARRVRYLELPNLPLKGDTTDWVAAGGTSSELTRLTDQAQDWDASRPRSHGTAMSEPLMLAWGAPLPSARAFIERHYTMGGLRTLIHHGGTFFIWTGSHYSEADEAQLRADVYKFLDGACRLGDDDKVVPFNPNRARVDNVLDALAAVANLSSSVRPPAWLGKARDLPADEIIACANGLLHLPTRKLLPHTAEFYTQSALSISYEPDAPEPREWLRFLDSLWSGENEAECAEAAEVIATLQEIFGYCLTADTRQQKIFLLVGPKRSGKGTIARILTKLVGEENVAGPTLASLGQNFGLAPLIGKRIAIISDARLGGHADQHAIVERLLAVSGEDALTIDRKHRLAWTGRLQARFVVLSNELPRLADASGAFSSRFILTVLTRSFFGQEDHHLEVKISAELPGILKWAIDGWRRLQDRGHFVQPASSAEVLKEFEDLTSPIAAFIHERCIVKQGRSVSIDALFERWSTWCKDNGRDRVGTKQTFGRDLRAAVPGIRVRQPRHEGDRVRVYEGIGLVG